MTSKFSVNLDTAHTFDISLSSQINNINNLSIKTDYYPLDFSNTSNYYPTLDLFDYSHNLTLNSNKLKKTASYGGRGAGSGTKVEDAALADAVFGLNKLNEGKAVDISFNGKIYSDIVTATTVPKTPKADFSFDNSKGERGEEGADGVCQIGDDGNKGEDGDRGEKGEKGPRGYDGNDGDKGEPGPIDKNPTYNKITANKYCFSDGTLSEICLDDMLLYKLINGIKMKARQCKKCKENYKSKVINKQDDKNFQINTHRHKSRT